MSAPHGKTEPWECTGENLYDACSAFMSEKAQCAACRANDFVLNSTAQEVVDLLDAQGELNSLRAEVERLQTLIDRPAWWTQLARENDALRIANARQREVLEQVRDDLEVVLTSSHPDAVHACARHASGLLDRVLEPGS